ncbi:protein Lines homolog 1 isoform X2 [Vanacampus margaritifer]
MASPCGSLPGLAAVLAELYKCSVNANATRPTQDVEELARAILCGVHAHRRHGKDAADVSCLALTLISKMVAAVTSHAAHCCHDVLEVLLQDLDVVSQMVGNFSCEDHVIRHMAAKSASACVVYQLQESGVVNPAWRGTCERALLSLPAGPRLDACLWSLTCVLQKLLRDNRQELVRTLVTAFDASVSAAAARFLPAGHAVANAVANDDAIADTFCLLLDLLEVLLAASAAVASSGARSPNLTSVHAAALMADVSRAPHYFVRKRVALLLKRALLRKAGEDWLGACGETAAPPADVGRLAAAAVDAVAADWLPSIRVELPSYLGGTGGGGEAGKCDTAMLRAVSLLVIKSVQHRPTSAAAGAGETGVHLARLWRFLREKGVRPPDGRHDCAVLPLLFAEQDDDLMEAAKAALAIFLRLRDVCGWDESTGDQSSCAAGCNPHCHFLFFLRAVSWDHRILLDFLVSAETCFLEYLLRYLRHLRSDRRGFAASCRRLDAEGPPGTGAWAGAWDCLVRLRLLVARLHRNKLFPYKADALLRLLTQTAERLRPD